MKEEEIYPVIQIYQIENGYILQVYNKFFCYCSLKELTDAVINKMPARKYPIPAPTRRYP